MLIDFVSFKASTSPSKETIESKPVLESLEAAKDVWRNWKSDKDTSSQQQEKETKSGALSAATTTVKPTASEVPPLMINGKPHSPFQLQIEYTTLDGDRCLRVITQTKPVTKYKNVADRGVVNVNICSNIKTVKGFAPKCVIMYRIHCRVCSLKFSQS